MKSTTSRSRLVTSPQCPIKLNRAPAEFPSLTQPSFPSPVTLANPASQSSLSLLLAILVHLPSLIFPSLHPSSLRPTPKRAESFSQIAEFVNSRIMDCEVQVLPGGESQTANFSLSPPSLQHPTSLHSWPVQPLPYLNSPSRLAQFPPHPYEFILAPRSSISPSLSLPNRFARFVVSSPHLCLPYLLLMNSHNLAHRPRPPPGHPIFDRVHHFAN